MNLERTIHAYGTSEGVTKAWDTRGRNGKSMHDILKEHGFKQMRGTLGEMFRKVVPAPRGTKPGQLGYGGRQHRIFGLKDEAHPSNQGFRHLSGVNGGDWDEQSNKELEISEHDGGIGPDDLEEHLNKMGL